MNLTNFDLDPFWIFLILLFFAILSTLLNSFAPQQKVGDLTGSILFWPNKKYQTAALLAAFLFLGMWRMAVAKPVINENHVAYYNNCDLNNNNVETHCHASLPKNKSISLVGQIVAEPDEREKGTKLTIGNVGAVHEPPTYNDEPPTRNESPTNNVVMSARTIPSNPAGGRELWAIRELPLRGKILLSAESYPAYQYGDWLKFDCELQTPGKIEDFDYGQYLGVKGIYSVCYQPEELTLVDGKLSVGQKFYRIILGAKKHYREIINQAVIYPHSELLNGLVLGARAGIPEKILQNFQDVGLTHIIAISGMNITIIAGLMMNLFIALGLRRGQAFYAAVGGLILFLLMIGWQASAVRAGIMGFIVLLAEKTGRLAKATRVLLLAAVIILLINPQALLGDVGFQLSFLAVLGIMYFDAPLEKLLTQLRVPEFLEIKASLKMTLAAQILVLPILLYYFGNLSLVAPLANILIVPLLPFITILGFIMIFVGLIFMPLAVALGYVARVILGWIILVAKYAAKLPGAGMGIGQFDFVYVVIIYMVMGWTIWIKNQKLKIKM